MPDINKQFERISIRGRYIYGLLCLQHVIAHSAITLAMPKYLEDLLHEYTSSDRLDLWFEKIEEVMPSRIFDSRFTALDYKYIPSLCIGELKTYYLSLGKTFQFVLEELLSLGYSNLYTSFRSDISVSHLADIVGVMQDNDIPLPAFSKVEKLSVEENHGWGACIDMKKYL